jgi:lysozyme
MRLVPNIRQKMRAYSIWSLMLSLALFLTPEFYYAYAGTELASPYLVGRLALFAGLFGIVGWFVDQSKPDMLRTAILAGLSLLLSLVVLALMALPARAASELQPAPPAETATGLPTWDQTAVYAVPIIKQWEGSGPTFACAQSARGICVRAYLDTIAEPDLPTICYGETSHTGVAVRMGDVRTIEQCVEGLSRIARDQYWSVYRRGVTIGTLAPQTDAAFTSLTWNIGVGAVLGSSALRALNAGDIEDACYRLTFWNKSGGHMVRGLVNRRAGERVLCRRGLA